MPAGQPALFKTVEELETKIQEYFDEIQGEFHFDADTANEGLDIKVWDKHPEPATITGLCLFLGFESRQSFHDYGKRTEYSYTIKRARLRIENEYEKTMLHSKNPTGQIFALKNLGWSDKQEIEHSNVSIKVTSKNSANA